ncbi:hypothetical protein, partial [Salmonella sp. SAL4445]|uniref:hypothetical protein n=1 Tax=Salmonella sp. SAL4445 TaxID=3159900 RepID=UPI00397DD65B
VATSEASGNWELVELRGDVAETIMEEEDLVLSTEEKVGEYQCGFLSLYQLTSYLGICQEAMHWL